MNREEFLNNVIDILQVEDPTSISFDTNLIDVDEWDSISIISMKVFLETEFNKVVSVDDLNDVDRIEDLAKIAGI